MPYCSRVSILCGKNVANRLIDLPDLMEARIKMRGDGYFRFYWDDVRWPDSSWSSENKAVNDIMAIVNDSISKTINDTEDGCIDDFCSFIRLGDNIGDEEHYNNSAALEKQWVKTEFDLVDDDSFQIPGRAVMIDMNHVGAKRMRLDGVWPKSTK